MADQEKQDGIREKLLAAALTLFNQKGYAATSVREIVEAAGVTKPVLYYYFGSKEGIYLELMDTSLAQFDAYVAQMTTISGPASDKIVHFCTMILELILQRLEVLRLIYAIYYGPPQGAPPIDFEDYYSRMIVAVEDLVLQGIADGEFVATDSKAMAWIVISILNTTMEEQICQTPPRIHTAQMELMLRMVLQGLTTQNGKIKLHTKEMQR